MILRSGGQAGVGLVFGRVAGTPSPKHAVETAGRRQRWVGDQSNASTAIPELLETLVLDGCIVTNDVVGCQKRIAQTILDRGIGDVLTLKGNPASVARGRGWGLCRRTGRGVRWLQPRFPQDREPAPRSHRDAPLLGNQNAGVHPMCGSRRGLIRPAEPGYDRRPTGQGEWVFEVTRYCIAGLPADARDLLVVRSHWQRPLDARIPCTES